MADGVEQILQGDVVRLDLRGWSSTGHEPDVGMFTGTQCAWKPTTTVPCPYCGVVLREVVSPDPRRIVRVLRREDPFIEVLAQPIPLTHRIVVCGTCCVQFTIPRRGRPA